MFPKPPPEHVKLLREAMGLEGIPKWILPTLVALVTMSFIPIVLIAKARTEPSAEPRIDIIPDMDNQPKTKTQSANPLFADGRGMRPVIPGTVARGELFEDDHLYRGKVGDSWATTFPMSVTGEVVARGRERYDITCAPCHGLTGNGDGMVARRADELQMATWVPPASFHTDLVRDREHGHLFNSITNGIRNMPAYGSQVTVDDRWAIVAYIRALQKSQNASVTDVPRDVRDKLR